MKELIVGIAACLVIFLGVISFPLYFYLTTRKPDYNSGFYKACLALNGKELTYETISMLGERHFLYSNFVPEYSDRGDPNSYSHVEQKLIEQYLDLYKNNFNKDKKPINSPPYLKINLDNSFTITDNKFKSWNCNINLKEKNPPVIVSEAKYYLD